MENSLNDLFSVILHSEKAALDEKQKCREGNAAFVRNIFIL